MCTLLKKPLIVRNREFEAFQGTLLLWKESESTFDDSTLDEYLCTLYLVCTLVKGLHVSCQRWRITTFWGRGLGGRLRMCIHIYTRTLWASLWACSSINFCCVLSSSRCTSIFAAPRVSCDELSWCFTECTSP